MKRFLLSLVAVIATIGIIVYAADAADSGSSSGTSETATFVFSEMGYTNQQTVTGENITKDGVTVQLTKGSNDPAYFTTGSGIRLYKGGTLIVTAVGQGTIDKIEISCASNYTLTGSTANSGSYSENGTLGTWTPGESTVSSVVLSYPSEASNPARIQKIVVTYKPDPSFVAAPTFSVEAGTYTENQTVSIAGPEGATIYYYTGEGEITEDNRTEYTEAIEVAETTTIQAVAVKGDNTSAVVSAEYVIEKIDDGVARETQTVTFKAENVAFSGDGSVVALPVGPIVGNPSPVFAEQGVCSLQWTKVNSSSSNVYSGGEQVRWYQNDILTITPAKDVIITKVEFTATENKYGEKSVTVSAGNITSSGLNYTWTGRQNTSFTLTPGAQIRFAYMTITCEVPLKPVAFNPAAGTYDEAQTVTLTALEEGASLYYFIGDGEITEENRTEYTTPIEVSASTTIQAVAVKDGVTSDVVTAEYILQPATPEITPSSTSYYTDKTVKISCSTKDVEIYYTTDGTTPTTASTPYTEEFEIFETTTVKAIAVSSLGTSEIAESEIIIKASNPVLDPPAGTYAEPVEVTMTSATTKAQIYYTLDDEVELTAETGTLYNSEEPVKIEDTATLRYIAVLGDTKTNVLSAEYVFNKTVKTVTFDFADAENLYGIEYSENDNDAYIENLEVEGITMSVDFAEATGNGRFRFFLSTNGVQTFRVTANGAKAGQTLTFSVPEGRKITTISFDGNNISLSFPGGGDWDSSEKVWTSSDEAMTSVTVVPTNTSTMSFSSITITTVESYAPVFNFSSGEYYESFDLTISAPMPGSKIYYTLDADADLVPPTEEDTDNSAVQLYTAPIAIKAGTPVTVRAIAVYTKDGVEEVSEEAKASYTWGTVDEKEDKLYSFQQVVDFFTKVDFDETTGVQTMPNLDKVIDINFMSEVVAVSPTLLYLDDTYMNDEINSMVLQSNGVDFTQVFEVGDIISDGLIVGWQPVNEVTPGLILKGNVDHKSSYGQSYFVPDTVSVAAINASAATNKDEIAFLIEHNEIVKFNNDSIYPNDKGRWEKFVEVPALALLNQTMINEEVMLTDITFSSATKANTGSTPNATFTGKDAQGNSVIFKTRLPIPAYAKGTYNVKGIVAYDVVITEEKRNKDDEITVEADTTVTAFVIPVQIAGDEADVTDTPFTQTEDVKAGKLVIAFGNLAAGPIAESKSYGYLSSTEIEIESGETFVSPAYIWTLIPSAYQPASRAAGEYFYLIDDFGRYYYQKINPSTGETYDSYNVGYELPDDLALASWSFEAADNGEMMITNAGSGKMVMFSSKYKTFGCYNETNSEAGDDERFLPATFQNAADISGIDVIEAAPEVIDGATEIFNLQGNRMPQGADLPAGLYIVRRGGTVTKVIVR